MTRRHLQPFRWIGQFAATRELNRQLVELQKAVYEALDGAFNSALDYVGLDGIDVVPGATQSVVRASRDTLTTTASGEIDSLGGIATKDFVHFDPPSHQRVNGLRPPGTDDTHRIMLCNVSAYTVTLAHDDADATTEEARILCPHGVDYELRPHECIAADWHVADQKYRVFGQSQPFHIVRTLTDLPTAVAGVITLPANSGIWRWVRSSAISGGTTQLVVSAGATVWSGWDSGWNSAPAAAAAAVVVNNGDNWLPFRVDHTSGGNALQINSTGGLSYFWQWQTNGNVINGANTDWYGGSFNVMTLTVSGGMNRFRGLINFIQLSCVGNRIDILDFKDCNRLSSYSGPMVLIADGISLNDRISIINCDAIDGTLVYIGDGLNNDGATGYVTIQGCTSTTPAASSVTCEVVPNGGLNVSECVLDGTTPFTGFTALTAKVIARGNRSASGTLLQETPNGHIQRSNAGAELTQRLYQRAGTGIEITDNGTESVYSSTIADVGIGAANTVLQTNAAANAREWELLFNANVDTNAAIAVTKLAVSGDIRAVLWSNGSANSWTPDPEVDNIYVYEALHLLSDDDPGDPADGVSIYYNGAEDKLIAAFDDTFRWDMIPNQPFVSGQHAKHFYERYVFDTDTAYTVLTESYTSPFGLTPGSSDHVLVEGYLTIMSVASGTSGGFRRYQFGLRWTDSGTLEYRWDTNDYSQGTSGAQLATTVFSISEGASTTAVFAVSVGAVDATMQFTIEGDVFVAPEPA